MVQDTPAQPVKVVVVGGGIAALELVLALHDLAGPRVEVTLVAPERDVAIRPMAVVAPFSRGHVGRLGLATFVDEHGGRFVRSAVERVDAGAHVVKLTEGADVPYDALVLAQGASEQPALPAALTFGGDPSAFGGLLADLEEGYSRSVAFVVPEGCTWPLPLYELALMTAEEVWGMNMERVDLHLVTPELEPLAIFGSEASTAVAELLDAARITTHLGVRVATDARTTIEVGPGQVIRVDRIVALPVLRGRRLDGIPSDAEGFTPVDDTGLVHGYQDVYAVGDVTDRPVKQGGLACQQADVTAAHLAARAGADVVVPPLTQVLRGRLLTGGRDRFLRREPGSDTGTVVSEPLWWPPAKVSGTYLSPYLAAKGLIQLPARGGPPEPGVEVHVEVPARRLVPGGVTGSSDLRPITPRHVGLRA